MKGLAPMNSSLVKVQNLTGPAEYPLEPPQSSSLRELTSYANSFKIKA